MFLAASFFFSASSAAFGAEPNSHVDPVTLALPGALPVLNRTAVTYAMMLGLALNCEIRRLNRFARKHYFYPDLPKGYQISQFEEPICERGHISILVNGLTRTIGITRIHMEEDAGKNIHDGRIGSSLVDLNRAGVPLLEVVTEPDLRSPAEAAAFMRSLRQMVCYLGISDGNMEEGSLRCDANVSVRPVEETKFGVRAEIKNLNSFRFVEEALVYEVARQVKLCRSGEAVVRETRLFDSSTGATRSMRGKEDSADYRYFPDPDLPPIVIEESWVRNVAEQMPKLPSQRKEELMGVYGLSSYDADVITAERVYVEYFDAVFAACSNAKAACNWITTELFGMLKKQGKSFADCKIPASDVGALIKLIDTETISGKIAKSVFEEMFLTGKNPEAIIASKGLKQISSPEEIERIVLQILAANPKQLQEFLDGNDKIQGFFVGQVMKATQGTANPKLVNETLQRELKLRRNG